MVRPGRSRQGQGGPAPKGSSSRTKSPTRPIFDGGGLHRAGTRRYAGGTCDRPGDQQWRNVGSIALRLADRNPAEAERVWNLTKGKGRRIFMDPILAWKLATVDPAAARRVMRGFRSPHRARFFFLFVALGARSATKRPRSMRSRLVSRESTGCCRRLPSVIRFSAGTFMPIVGRIDPALVPEVFWLDVSSRLAASNPRMRTAGATAPLIERLAWYDREVAAALFEPARARIDRPMVTRRPILPWHPGGVCLRQLCRRRPLENRPSIPGQGDDRSCARLVVAESLAQDHEQRWRRIWRDWT